MDKRLTCKNCGNLLKGNQRKWCSTNCGFKFKYHSDEEFRNKDLLRTWKLQKKNQTKARINTFKFLIEDHQKKIERYNRIIKELEERIK